MRLIDADETLSSLSNDLPYKGSVRRVLMQAPTVDGVHAHWIHHPDNLFPTESTMECSHCHEEETVFILNDNYCPNCGAKVEMNSTGTCEYCGSKLVSENTKWVLTEKKVIEQYYI